MNKQLSPEQEQINIFIEQLHIRKERIKQSIAFLNNEVISIDIELRRLRQLFPTLAIVEEKRPRKHKETDEEKLERLTKELDALKAGMRK